MGTDHGSFYSEKGSYCLECKLPKAEVWPGSFLHPPQHVAPDFHLENVKVRFFSFLFFFFKKSMLTEGICVADRA